MVPRFSYNFIIPSLTKFRALSTKDRFCKPSRSSSLFYLHFHPLFISLVLDILDY